jgi:hypothetical protein
MAVGSGELRQWTKSTGSTGTMMIQDDGTYVTYYLKAGSQTYNYQLPWAYVINGNASGWKYFRFEKGGDWQKIGVAKVSYSQTVTFKLGNTGTAGLGGPTTFSVYIDRAGTPHAPYYVATENVTSNSFRGRFKDGADNGADIDSRQIGYGTSSSSPQKTITAKATISIDGSWFVDVTGLSPGTTYYFWGRTHNREGWSTWTLSHKVTTLSTVKVNVGGVWKDAIPYVNVAGVWKVASPWTRSAGVWKEAK